MKWTAVVFLTGMMTGVMIGQTSLFSVRGAHAATPTASGQGGATGIGGSTRVAPIAGRS